MITQEELKERLSYDPDTGVFKWKSAARKADIGRVAGWINKPHSKAYVGIKLYNKTYKAHRLAWLYMTGSFPDGVIDHIDGDGTKNEWVNLRCVNQQENCRNAKKKATNKSGFCGVSIDKQSGKWRARIRHKGEYKHLGLFVNKEDAAMARKQAEKAYGYHVNHGSIRPL